MAVSDVYLTISRIRSKRWPLKNPFVPYMSCGLRRYNLLPVEPYGRPCWEFQCVIRGRAHSFPFREEGITAPPALYIFPPGHPHGWTAPAGDLSEILVFHIGSSAVSRITAQRTSGEPAVFVLTESDLLRLRSLYDWLHPHFVDVEAGRPEVLSAGVVLLWDLWQELENRTPLRPGTRAMRAADRIEQALAFYRRSVTRNPSVEEIASLAGLSASQLRRAFAAAGQPPPAEMFRTIQMDLARRLLSRPEETVSHTADEMGFGSLSAFSRAFTKHFGKSPRQLREIP